MQRVWDVIQGTIFTAAAVELMALVANQAIDRNPVIVAVSKPVKFHATAAQEPVRPQSQRSKTIDIPIPDGRISGITQTITISGGRIVSASVTFDQ